MKRWGFAGGPASHGSTKFHRKPGGIGGGGVSLVYLVLDILVLTYLRQVDVFSTALWTGSYTFAGCLISIYYCHVL